MPPARRAAKHRPAVARLSRLSLDSSWQATEEPLPVATASFLPQKEPQRAPTQSAKQFAASRVKPKVELPASKADLRSLPQAAWSKIYAQFAIESVESVKRALHSVMPAVWSSFHSQWTGQKVTAPVPEAALELESQPKETVQEGAVVPVKAAVLCSLSPALWSPLHRKWCGQPALVPVAKLLQSMTNFEAIMDVQVVKVEKKLQVKYSVAPAVYSKWHGRWTGGRP